MKLQNEDDKSREPKGGGTPGPAIKMFLRQKGGKKTHWIFIFIYILPQEPKQSGVLSYNQLAPARWLQILCVGVNSFAQGHGMVMDEIRGKNG